MLYLETVTCLLLSIKKQEALWTLTSNCSDQTAQVESRLMRNGLNLTTTFPTTYQTTNQSLRLTLTKDYLETKKCTTRKCLTACMIIRNI